MLLRSDHKSHGMHNDERFCSKMFSSTLRYGVNSNKFFNCYFTINFNLKVLGCFPSECETAASHCAQTIHSQIKLIAWNSSQCCKIVICAWCLNISQKKRDTTAQAADPDWLLRFDHCRMRFQCTTSKTEEKPNIYYSQPPSACAYSVCATFMHQCDDDVCFFRSRHSPKLRWRVHIYFIM